MPSFVVETYVPVEAREGFKRCVAELQAAATRSQPGSVRHVRSFLVPDDEMGFHVLEARSVADVARFTEAAGIEAERVVGVVAVDVPERDGPR